jgi:beta-glucosidase-like glycosyl hydrolase
MSLVKDMGNVIGRELRAYYNAKVHNSLDTWSPTININRDPRWGRNVESPGEDPLVCGSYGSAYTQGLQQYTGTEKVVQAVVTLKHYFAYSIEQYSSPTSKDPAEQGVQRYSVDVKISAHDLAATYFPAWEQTIKEGKALGVMCSCEYCTVSYRATSAAIKSDRHYVLFLCSYAAALRYCTWYGCCRQRREWSAHLRQPGHEPDTARRLGI